jgi:predicted DNA-binding transcriptional regulator YafY
MPHNKHAFTRYRVIDNCLNDKWKKYPTIENLADACTRALGTTISTSTIEKDIAAMKQGMPLGQPAPIIYNKTHKGYAYGESGFTISELRLEEEEWEALAYASNLLNHYKDVPLFSAFAAAIQKIHSRFTIPFDHKDENFEQLVQFEKGNETTGYQWIALFYESIKKKHPVQFVYENIYKNEINSYLILPYLLKEYRNRWYIIGWEETRERYLTFALDRITKPVVQRIPKKRKDFNAREFLKNAIGIMEGDGSATEIVLEIFSPIDKLVLLEPLHVSQEIISQTPKSTRIKLNVNVNPELTQKILAFGVNCRVESPAALQEIIKTDLRKTLQYYK